MVAALRLQSHVWNADGGRRALLLHGLGSDGTTWWRLASQLAEDGWLVIAPDLRGHGRSPTAEGFTLAHLAADAAAVGDGWDLVVGHSLGGAIAAELLASDVEVAAAVLIDPVLRLASEPREALRTSMREQAGGVDADAIRRDHPAWDERDVWRKVLAARLFTPDVVDAVLDHNDPWDLTDRTSRWRARTHLLSADPEVGDVSLDPALAQHLASQPTDAGGRVTAEVVAGAGHSIQRDRPEAVLAAVRKVVAEVGVGGVDDPGAPT